MAIQSDLNERTFTRTTTLLVLLAFAHGCQPVSEPPLAPSTQTSAARIAPQAAATTHASGELVADLWDAYSMVDPASGKATRIGHAHTTIHRVADNGQSLVRTTSVVHTAMQRSGQDITQDMTITSWDTEGGELVRFETRVSGAGGEITMTGAVESGMLSLDTTTLGRTQSQQISWPQGAGGLFAAEHSLRRNPLKPGERRTVHGLMPLLNLPVKTELRAEDFESVELPLIGGARPAKLLKVTAMMDLGVQKLETLLWITPEGETVKTLVPSIGQQSVRTTKEDALRQGADKPYDLLFASTVPLKGTLANPQTTRRAVYLARLKAGAIQGLFREGPTQQVKLLDDRSAQITVLSVRPNGSKDAAAPPAQTLPADLASNNFIQTDDPLVRQLAASVKADAADPWQTACLLEKLVADQVENKSYSQAFASAAEVARTKEGDCTEHAVLLAALCRVHKIPARCAFGLVYYPPERGFAYHMWNEVLIDGVWVPLDATLGQGGIAADHIKLGDSNLAGGSPLADLLAVIQVFGRLELEVVETSER